MNRFMTRRRDSQTSVQITPTAAEKPGVSNVLEKPDVSNSFVVAETTAREDSDDVAQEVERMLVEAYSRHTRDQLRRSWLEFLAGSDQLQQPRSGGVGGGSLQPPQTAPNLPATRSRDTDDGRNRRDHASAGQKAAVDADREPTTAKIEGVFEARPESRIEEARATREKLTRNAERYGHTSDKMESYGIHDHRVRMLSVSTSICSACL